MTAPKIAREIVGQWKFKGKGYDVTCQFSDHDINQLVEHITKALDDQAAKYEAQLAHLNAHEKSYLKTCVENDKLIKENG